MSSYCWETAGDAVEAEANTERLIWMMDRTGSRETTDRKRGRGNEGRRI